MGTSEIHFVAKFNQWRTAKVIRTCVFTSLLFLALSEFFFVFSCCYFVLFGIVILPTLSFPPRHHFSYTFVFPSSFVPLFFLPFSSVPLFLFFLPRASFFLILPFNSLRPLFSLPSTIAPTSPSCGFFYYLIYSLSLTHTLSLPHLPLISTR